MRAAIKGGEALAVTLGEAQMVGEVETMQAMGTQVVQGTPGDKGSLCIKCIASIQLRGENNQ